jgi:hypothetical protein
LRFLSDRAESFADICVIMPLKTKADGAMTVGNGTKLPVWSTIGRAYGLVFANLAAFAALAALPVGLSYLVLLAGDSLAARLELHILARLLLEQPLRWLFWIVFAVAWHRYVLLGRPQDRRWLGFRFGRRELRFFLYALALALPFVVAFLPLFIVPPLLQKSHWTTQLGAMSGVGLVMLVIFAGGFFLSVRFSFILPSVSVDRPAGLDTAWAETRGSGWRIFAATMLGAIPLGVLDQLLRALIIELGGRLAAGGTGLRALLAALPFGQLLISFLFTAILVSILSLAFRARSGWQPPATN